MSAAERRHQRQLDQLAHRAAMARSCGRRGDAEGVQAHLYAMRAVLDALGQEAEAQARAEAEAMRAPCPHCGHDRWGGSCPNAACPGRAR